MGEHSGEKTEQPTPRKLEEAWKHGQIAHSAEVQTVFVLVAGLMALMFTGHETWRQLVNLMTATLGHLHDLPVTLNSVNRYGIEASLTLGMLVGPLVIAVMLGGLLAGGIQNRFRTASEAMEPSWERLNPVAGLQRIFSMRSALPTGLAVVKVSLIVALCYSVVQEILADPIFFTAVSPARIAEFFASSSSKIILRVAGTLAIIATVDYAYQIWRTNEDLKMTKEEVKEEMKNSEGNPEVKGMRRRKMLSFRKAKALQEVPKADVVVRNPTHYAVALRYDRKTMRAPRIVAKGSRLNALRIIAIAEKHQVPIVENRPLARLMFRHGKVGGEIPAELYKAVAEVLAWVYRVNRYRYYAEQNQASN